MAACPKRDAKMLRFLHSSKAYSLPIHKKVFFLVALRPNVGRGLVSLQVSRSHTTTHRSR